jgi:hypothetical protein
MLKNPAKAIKFYSDTHDNTPLIPPFLNKGGIRGVCILQKRWLARLMGCKVSLVGLFQHICLTN